MPTNIDVEVWYVREVSQRGVEDWSVDGAGTFDSIRAANRPYKHPDFNYRIVKKTLLSEVVEG